MRIGSWTSDQNSDLSLNLWTWPWSWSDFSPPDTALSECVSHFTSTTIMVLQHLKASSFLPHYRRTYMITTLSLWFKVWPHIRSSLVDCPVTYCLQMCSNMIFTIADIFFFPIYLVSVFPLVHTARTHGSCTHSRNCLYMWGYFQTEPVKDIQPVVNTGFEGGVSVFYLSCLFTGAPPALCGPER